MQQKRMKEQSVRAYSDRQDFTKVEEQQPPIEKTMINLHSTDGNGMPTVLNTFFIQAQNIDVLETYPVPELVPPARNKPQSVWMKCLQNAYVRVASGLLVGIALLVLVAHFVDIPATIHVLQKNLMTPHGMLLAACSGIAFLLAYTTRGIRWKLFLSSVSDVSISKTARLFLIGIFINFLLPVQGGEVVKSVLLKRITGIPVSQSLPTVAMDKSLDLMPALIIMAIVPFLGIHMDMRLWLVLGIVGALFIGVLLLVIVAMWKRTLAIELLHHIIGRLPAIIANKAENFAIGFIDSLLLGVRRPKTYMAAILLTCVAVVLDSLYSFLAFRAIGVPISFGTALFGYTIFNLFYILPNPPGQVGSNEGVGLLIYTGLLHMPADKVLAVIVFAHPFSALIMCVAGLLCLSSFGLTISGVMKVDAVNNVELVRNEKEQ